MNAIVLPLPLDSWETFRPDIERFCDTFRQYPPGADYVLLAMCCKSQPSEEVRRVFHGINAEFRRYDGNGCDIGAHQHLAFEIGEAFQVNLSSRVVFNRAGWLKKILEVRDYFGPGLFGTAVSNETGRLHFRTHCYGIEARFFRRYPWLINTRNLTFGFEHGAIGHPSGGLLAWAQTQPDMSIACVYWDGGWRPEEWFSRPNIFRSGDQSNLLVQDRHSLIFDAMVAEEKRLWSNRALSGTD